MTSTSDTPIAPEGRPATWDAAKWENEILRHCVVSGMNSPAYARANVRRIIEEIRVAAIADYIGRRPAESAATEETTDDPPYL